MRFLGEGRCLLLLVLLAALAGSAATQELYEPDRVGWTRVELEASRLWVTARSEVDLARHAAPEAAAALFTPPGPVLAPAEDESFLITIRTRVLGRDSRVRFWFDPGDARALERSELKLAGKRSRHRTYRYAPAGVHAHTREPADGEVGRPHAAWSSVSDHYIAFPEGLDGAVVTEPAALLYVVPAAALAAPGDEVRMHVFSRRRVNVVDVAVASRERVEVDYVEVAAAGERRVDGEVETLRVTLRPRPLPGQPDEGGIKLLGLEGDIELFLDPRTRAPLLVTGRIDVAGRVRLRAKRVVLKAPAAGP